MSLSHRSSQRSWGLGTGSSSSINTGSLTSRSLNTYSSPSVSARSDYGTASTARYDYRNTSSTRSGLYTPSSSSVARSSSTYGDTSSSVARSSSTYGDTSSGVARSSSTYGDTSSGVARSSSTYGDTSYRRSSNAGTLSQTGSRSRVETASKHYSACDSLSPTSPTSAVDISSSYENVSSRRTRYNKDHTSYRNRNEVECGDDALPGASRISGRVVRDENDHIEQSSSVDPKRKPAREDQTTLISTDLKKGSETLHKRGSLPDSQESGRRSMRPADKDIHVQNSSIKQHGEPDTSPTSLPQGDHELSTFTLQEKASRRGLGPANQTSKEYMVELTEVPLSTTEAGQVGTSHSKLKQDVVCGHGFSGCTSKCAETSGFVTGHSDLQLAAGKPHKADVAPSEDGQCFKNTSVTKEFSRFHVSKDATSDKTSRVRLTCQQQDMTGTKEHFCEDRSKKPRTTSVTNDSTAGSIAQAEIIRLESLCEARTKELTNTKMQFRAAAQAFDAMAVLVDYCCTDLNAFECPGLARKLDTVEMQLANCITQIADLSCQRDNLDKNLNQVMQEKEEALRKAEEAFNTVHKEREEHARLNHEMDDTHNAALTTQRDELTSKHDETMKKVTQFYDRQIDLLRQAHDRQMTDVKNECKLEMNGVKISHLEEIQELRNKHDSQMEELHKQHRNKLEDITHRFESIKLTLSEKVESLRVECDDLARRARNSEEALQRDADAKVQIALAPYLCLPKEIESLKTVVEMRNEEIQKLRTKNMDLEKQLEEVPIGRDKIISLQQKVENLEAIIDIKTDHEKQLHEKCQVLMRKYDRESRANKRLSMDYEQVVWRMSQSSEFGSSESLTRRNFSWSPPCSEEGSPDSRYRAMSPNTGTSDVVMRVKKRSSHSISEGDRKLRSRSATFVLEKNESRDSHSPSSSPQLKQKRWRKKSQTEEVTAETEQPDLMSHSAGTEILSNVPVQGKEIGGQKDNRDFNGLHMASSGEMVTSYSRSLSGVSDSGMYDSMTRSDVLDSSLVSTDSDWGTSVNLTLKCNSAMDGPESCPLTGGYESSNDITVIHVKQSSSDSDSGNVTVNSLRSDSSSRHPSSSEGQSEDHKQFSSCQVNVTVSLDAALAEDGVFDERVHVDSS